MTIGVNITTFTLRKKYSRKKDEYIPFYSDFSQYKEDCIHHNVTMIDVIKLFHNSISQNERIDNQSKLFGANPNSYIIKEKNGKIYISFTVNCGAYGIKSELTNINNNEKVFDRKIEHADVKEFRVMFVFNKNQEGTIITKGMMLLEVIGPYGIKSIIMHKIMSFFSNIFNITASFNTATNRETLESLCNNGNIKELQLIKNEPSAKYSNMFGINDGKEVKKIIVSQVNQKKTMVDRLVEIGEKLSTGDNAIYEIEDEIYNDVSIKVKVADRVKTVSLRDINNIYIVESLPDNVVDEEGKLNVNNMDIALANRANEYLKNLVEGSIEND